MPECPDRGLLSGMDTIRCSLGVAEVFAAVCRFVGISLGVNISAIAVVHVRLAMDFFVDS